MLGKVAQSDFPAETQRRHSGVCIYLCSEADTKPQNGKYFLRGDLWQHVISVQRDYFRARFQPLVNRRSWPRSGL